MGPVEQLRGRKQRRKTRQPRQGETLLTHCHTGRPHRDSGAAATAVGGFPRLPLEVRPCSGSLQAAASTLGEPPAGETGPSAAAAAAASLSISTPGVTERLTVGVTEVLRLMASSIRCASVSRWLLRLQRRRRVQGRSTVRGWGGSRVQPGAVSRAVGPRAVRRGARPKQAIRSRSAAAARGAPITRECSSRDPPAVTSSSNQRQERKWRDNRQQQGRRTAW